MVNSSFKLLLQQVVRNAPLGSRFSMTKLRSAAALPRPPHSLDELRALKGLPGHTATSLQAALPLPIKVLTRLPVCVHCGIRAAVFRPAGYLVL